MSKLFIGKTHKEFPKVYNFFTILTSIEDRLRSLDSVYTMQLSQTLESKLDQYNRRLESLDTKIIRLESLVMLNLDKISENISTKNFKDDVTKTNTMRKLDSVYEGINHRLSYLERRLDTHLAKIQTKVDTTLTHLEKIEDNFDTRGSDIEAELSDTNFAIDDLKTAIGTMEQKLLNTTSTSLNVTKNNYDLFKDMYIENRKALNRLHDNIVENLQYMDNRTSRHIKTNEENNLMLKTMRNELKEDFNDYANKVADMSSNIWKVSDTTEEDLKRLATSINSTKVEIQNGIRSLMLQIGKLSGKDNVIPVPVGSNGIAEINNKMTSNFEKILSNQDLFLESCHRLQMDESQIESEISDMLEKLIDMLEKRFQVKDIKNLEKAFKNHDNRINRNLYQANNNIISLFEKTNIYNDEMKRQTKKIGETIDLLTTYIQNVTAPGPSGSMSPTNNVDLDMKDLIDKLFELTKNATMTNNSTRELLIQEIPRKLELIYALLQVVDFKLTTTFNEPHIENIFNKILPRHLENISCITDNLTAVNTTPETIIDEDTRKIISEIFGTNPTIEDVKVKTPENALKKDRCKQNYRNLIDIRDGVEKCVEVEEENNKHSKQRKGRKKMPSSMDVRGNFNDSDNIQYSEYENATENVATETLETTTESIVIVSETTYTPSLNISNITDYKT
ncbi:hypothetical protein NQ317_009114 [Molorchus minor]|uniref:Uncharacterized protein n=1 Tax=Molorchus minor TaxID=1323400 RepID=A0ABQ9JF58_9CUCU|nr:hypothetical protein NQ317_009114 [Molorchus minor]